MDENELWIQLKKENKELSKTLDKLDKKTYKIQKEINFYRSFVKELLSLVEKLKEQIKIIGKE